MGSTVQGPRPFIITMLKVGAEPKTGRHEHIEQDEQTGHDESDFAVAVAISDSRSSGNAD
jgi:hypothetical protein